MQFFRLPGRRKIGLSKATYLHKNKKDSFLRAGFSLRRCSHFYLLKKIVCVCYGSHMTDEAKRYRKKIATTVHPDTYWVVQALSEPDRKGHFLDEAIEAYLTTCYWFNVPDHGALKLQLEGFYHFVDLNGEKQSPVFKTMTQALIWLRDTYPDSNTINIPKDSGGSLF